MADIEPTKNVEQVATKDPEEIEGDKETVEHYALRTMMIKGFPPHFGDRQIRKFMNSQSVEYEQMRTFVKSAKFWLTFKTQEDKEAAMKKLDGTKPPKLSKKLKCYNAEADGNWMEQEGKRKLDDSAVGPPSKKRKIDEGPKELKSPAQVLTPLFDVPYPQQCLKKIRTVRKAMRNFLKNLRQKTPFTYPWLEHETITNPIGCLASPQTTGYRNKDSFTVGVSSEGVKMAGCRLGSTKDGVVEIGDISGVTNFHPASIFMVKSLNELLASSPYDAYDRYTHNGVWRQMMIRTSHKRKELLVVLICQLKDLSEDQQTALQQEMKSHFLSKAAELKEAVGFEICGILFQSFDGVCDSVPIDHPYMVLHGNPFITESLSGLSFQVSFQSFFQVNVPQAERMFEVAAQWARASPNTVLFDVCCGTGTIGLTLAKSVSHVVGLELIPEAVKDANKNKELNDITNCDFYVGRAEKTIKDAIQQHYGADIVAIVDPPRSGLHPSVLKTLRKYREIKRVVYISCNPTTCANDCVTLCRGQTNKFAGPPFKPIKTLTVDMFPQTPHTEMVMLLERTTATDEITRNEKKNRGQKRKRKNKHN